MAARAAVRVEVRAAVRRAAAQAGGATAPAAPDQQARPQAAGSGTAGSQRSLRGDFPSVATGAAAPRSRPNGGAPSREPWPVFLWLDIKLGRTVRSGHSPCRPVFPSLNSSRAGQIADRRVRQRLPLERSAGDACEAEKPGCSSAMDAGHVGFAFCLHMILVAPTAGARANGEQTTRNVPSGDRREGGGAPCTARRRHDDGRGQRIGTRRVG